MSTLPSKYQWQKLISMGVLRKGESIEGVVYVTNGRRWGAMDFEGNPIIPVEYDFIDVDEYEYGHLWIVCGRDGYHYLNGNTICYSGVYDIYSFSGTVVLKGLDHYDNGNHSIDIIMHEA